MSARGDAARFRTRLAWEGLSPTSAAAMLGAISSGPPSATDLCEELDPARGTLADAASALAMAVGRRLLGERRLSPDAARDVVAGLRRQLTAVAVRSGSAAEPAAEHPALASLLATVAHGRALAVVEAMERLSTDAELLRDHLLVPVGETVATIVATLSDPHDGGRTVMALSFGSHRCVIYKPRSCGPEAWLSETMSELPGLGLRGPTVLDRGTHGWVACVRRAGPPADMHRRHGALLALAHVLGATDLHEENLVMSDAGLVVLDAETLLQPEPVQGAGEGFSVLDTELVCPVMGLPPEAAAEVAASFASACRALLEADDLLERQLARLVGPLRHVMRPTRVYATVMEASLRPRRPGWDIDRMIELDALARSALAAPSEEASTGPPVAWKIVEAERAALKRGDVPRFTVDPRGHDLYCGDATLAPGFFRRSPVERATQRLATLSANEVTLDAATVEQALARPTPPSRPPRARKPSDWLGLAVEIARVLERRALRGDDGSVAWLGTRTGAWGTTELRSLGGDLYAGASGVALYAGWLARVTGDPRWSDLAAAAVLGWRGRVRALLRLDPADRPTHPHGLAGLASVAHAWPRIGELLGDEGIAADGRAACALALNAEAPCEDDLVSGIAGSLLAAVTAGRAAEAEWLARRLLVAGRPAAERCSARGGLAHGPGGVSLALARLSSRTHDPDVRDAAREALRRDGALLGHGWCRGTAGRLAVELELASGSGGHDAARRLVDATSTPQTRRLGFCCGVAGQVDVLVLAAERLDEPALARAARRSALAARPRIERLLRNESLQPFDPGLFTGWAGIGYALLRLLRPEDVPSLAVLS